MRLYVLLATVSLAAKLCAQTEGSYNVRVAVDEVSLTFHASDAHGLPVNDLKLEEVRLLDDGKPPRRILAFESTPGLPIRAGILLDRSPSMGESCTLDRTIAMGFVQRLARQPNDQAFVMQLDSTAAVDPAWTHDPASLAAGIRNAAATHDLHQPGTALYTALYQACLNQFSHLERGASANAILLFSDGVDNASRVSLQQAVDMCQKTNTAIYAFHSGSQDDGPKTLATLAGQTGGRVFHDDDSGQAAALAAIEQDLRTQYHLVYRPQALTHDGSFHSLAILGPDRAPRIDVRTGYYAPQR